MAPAVVLGAAQTLSLFSNAKSYSFSREESVIVPPGAGADVAKDRISASVDTVSLSSQSRQAVADVKKEETAVKAAEREKVVEKESAIANSEGSNEVAAKVEFVYDQNGELSVKYMDTSGRLVYQLPSELQLQMKEAASKADTTVDTKA